MAVNAGRILLCGGFDHQCNHNDVWLFDPSQSSFSRPSGGHKRVPVHGAYHSLVYDGPRHEALLFGGQCCIGGPYEFYNSVFVAALADPAPRWEELRTCGEKPPARAQHAAALAGSLMLVHGGADARRGFNDLWALSLAASPALWSEVKVAGGSAPLVQPYLRPKDFQVDSCRPFMAVHGSRVLVLGRTLQGLEGRHHRKDRGRMGLFSLDLVSRLWRQLPNSKRRPGWAGNFAAWIDGLGSEERLRVLSGHLWVNQGWFADGGGDSLLRTLPLKAKPSAMVVRTLIAAWRVRGIATVPSRLLLPAECVSHILDFLTGHVLDVMY